MLLYILAAARRYRQSDEAPWRLPRLRTQVFQNPMPSHRRAAKFMGVN